MQRRQAGKLDKQLSGLMAEQAGSIKFWLVGEARGRVGLAKVSFSAGGEVRLSIGPTGSGN